MGFGGSPTVVGTPVGTPSEMGYVVIGAIQEIGKSLSGMGWWDGMDWAVVGCP